MPLSTILLVIFILMLLGAIRVWPHSRSCPRSTKCAAGRWPG